MPHPSQTPSIQKLRWFGWTDCGKGRPNNEDSFLALQFNAREVHYLGKHGEAELTNMDFVFAVSDGMGGAHSGEYASRIVVEKIAKLLPRSFKQSAVGLEAGRDDVLSELFTQIHRALAYLGSSYEECAGMGATLTLAWFTPGWMYFAHIGDSRIYYLPANGDGIKQLSHDDTHVGWLLRTGKISEREAREHPRRNMLQKALGAGNQFIDPQLGAVGYESGDIFLLCSDGLVEKLYDNHLVEILRKSKNARGKGNPAHQLVMEALDKQARDNTTALVVRIL